MPGLRDHHAPEQVIMMSGIGTEYAERHFAIKSQHCRASTVERDRRALRHVFKFFGADVRLTAITVARLNDYVLARKTVAQAQTILHELHAVSNLFNRALSEGFVRGMGNPVVLMTDKPRVERKEAVWLEVGEAARLLEVAKEMDAKPSRRAVRYLYPLLASYLYTGGRKNEVMGSQFRDYDFRHRTVHVRPNKHRQLKRPHHARNIPLWPHFEAILHQYYPRWEPLAGWKPIDLMFPSNTDERRMMTDVRTSLQRAVERADIVKSEPVTLRTLRHTYIATRMQTTDNGQPVSPYTVMREVGHRDLTMILRVYGHLQNTRSRQEAVEYTETKELPFTGERHG